VDGNAEDAENAEEEEKSATKFGAFLNSPLSPLRSLRFKKGPDLGQDRFATQGAAL